MAVERDLFWTRYVASDSVLHGLDARTKVFGGVLLLGWLVVFSGWGSFVLLAGVLAVLLRASGLPLGCIAGNLRALTALWLLCVAVSVLLPGGGEPLWRSPSWAGVMWGVERGLFLCFRLGLLVAVGLLFSLTTAPAELLDAVEWQLRGVPALSRASGRVALVIVLAWGFIPVLVDEARRLRQAQRARGGHWREGWVGEIMAWRSTFVPLLIGTLRSSGGFALAMEARGFGGGGRRSFYCEFRLGRRDAVAMLLCLAATVGGGFLWAWERTL